MAFLGGLIHGAVDGAGECSGANQPSTFQVGLQIHEANMQARARRIRAREAEAERQNQIWQEQQRINNARNDLMRRQQELFYNSPEQVALRRQAAERQARETAEREARSLVVREEIRQIRAHSAAMSAEMSEAVRLSNIADDRRRADAKVAKAAREKAEWAVRLKVLLAEDEQKRIAAVASIDPNGERDRETRAIQEAAIMAELDKMKPELLRKRNNWFNVKKRSTILWLAKRMSFFDRHTLIKFKTDRGTNVYATTAHYW